MLYQSRQRESFDTGLVFGAELDDIDADAIADYRQARAEANPDAEGAEMDGLELLRKALNAVRRDAAGAWKPTVAGLLLRLEILGSAALLSDDAGGLHPGSGARMGAAPRPPL